MSDVKESEFKQLSRSVKGLTVIVTGAANGMGRATARVFAAEGANVAVTDYDGAGASAVADAITASGGAARAWQLDVADAEAKTDSETGANKLIGKTIAAAGDNDATVRVRMSQ